MLRSNLQTSTKTSNTTAATTPPSPPPEPTIRLISAIPSASGVTSKRSLTNLAINTPWDPPPPLPTVLAPKADSPATRKRLVPKKSKLSMLGVGREKERGNDLSDVVRRVGGNSASARGGFEIYVDPTIDEDIAEVVVVKKKSRAALNGMRWGTLGEVTNVPSVTASKAPAVTAPKAPVLTKAKNDENNKDSKWWSIGRGRKDSKEKTEKSVARGQSPEPPRDPYPRSKTPEPFKLSQPAESSRGRFNSLDSGILLNPTVSTSGAFFPQGPSLPEERPARSTTPTFTRSVTPTPAAVLAPQAPPAPAPTSSAAHQGSIALRAIRSVRSLARIGSWAQLRNSDENTPSGSVKVKATKEKKEKAVKEKKMKKEEGEKEKKSKKSKKEKDAVEREDVKKKKKKTKKKEKETEPSPPPPPPQEEQAEDAFDPPATIRRNSGSSFEIGSPTPMPKEKTHSLGKKKRSILGIGLPSTMTMRLPSVRKDSNTSSINDDAVLPPPPPTANRLSIDSARVISMEAARDRAGSAMSTSTGSSLRPMSITSTTSGSRISSGSSVRWDEGCLEHVKETRRRERREREKERAASGEAQSGKRSKSTESKHSVDGRKRTALSDVFPMFARPESPEVVTPKPPALAVESATADGHVLADSILGEEALQRLPAEEEEVPLETPMKKPRPRPLSEQSLGRSRPKPMYEDQDGVLSILDAATDDLAQLINVLDLEATPATPDMTPLRPSDSLVSINDSNSSSVADQDSPTKSKSKLSNGLSFKGPHNVPSISSLRPYAQSRKNMPVLATVPSVPERFLAQQIAPWSTLQSAASPVKSLKKAPSSLKDDTSMQTVRLTKPTMSPGPEPEPEPVFHPLRPAKSRSTLAALRAQFESPEQKTLKKEDSTATVRASSMKTFGRRSSSSTTQSILNASFTTEPEPIPTHSPVFKRPPPELELTHKRSTPVPMDIDARDKDNDTVPIPPSARRILGMSGTMGGFDVSAYALEQDTTDPDSDIPDELQNILSNQSDDGDTMSFHSGTQENLCVSFVRPANEAEAPSGPPNPLKLPAFSTQLINGEDSSMMDADAEFDEDSTKKSFDFTWEIKKLNESCISDTSRQSFVEQLESAFKTPAKVDLRYGFPDSLLSVEAPPVPKLPAHLANQEAESSSSAFHRQSEPRLVDREEQTNVSERFMFSGSHGIREPTSDSDSLTSTDDVHDIIMSDSNASPTASRTSLRGVSSSGSRPSQGQLNRSFKFGGLPQAPPVPAFTEQDKPKTLADIIPPPSHARSLSNSSMVLSDDSVLQSILGHAPDVPHPRVRLNSDASVQSRASENLPNYRHSRHSSGNSFAGFDSFDEVRRGFEFSIDQPFYPPAETSRRTHRRHQESIFSLASVSSYGRAHDYGLPDPFGYSLSPSQGRPISQITTTSMSMSIDDTFSFINHQPRKRVASDASSFYFKAPSALPFNRGHRRQESNMSVSSLAPPPPVSWFNRNVGSRRRADSSASAQSVAPPYARHSAIGGRATLARHRRDVSMDSINSDFSVMRLGRPDIGDKMFGDSTGDFGAPRSSVLVSPLESVAEQHFVNHSPFEYDSIIDHDQQSFAVEDSLFDKSGERTSSSSDSVFGCNDPQAQRRRSLAPPRYRPVSMLSIDEANSPPREDDTMVSMLGGGHVRRQSVDASPCFRIEKRKYSEIQPQRYKVPREYRESPNKARIVEKPSIASTSSFGDERMIKAKHGLLERHSLEDSCLVANGLGEDVQTSLTTTSLFSRPAPATRSRSSTVTSSSGGDTPPLTSCDDISSVDEGSQSSIDLSWINLALANGTQAMPTLAKHRVRARARGHKRASYIRPARNSVYETIQEEMPSPAKSTISETSTPSVTQPVFIVEPDVTEVDPAQIWDDENGIQTLRRYYALKDEAQTTVVESKRIWHDTPFSLYAVQSFEPPRHPAEMRKLLEHSVQNFGPLPSELRPRRIRSRTSSRASPYPQARVNKVILSPPEVVQPTKASPVGFSDAPVLKQVPIDANVTVLSMAPNLGKPMDIDTKHSGLPRPRVGSNPRRPTLGLSKRVIGSNKTSAVQKENVVGHGTQNPGDSLRINRPRPRGRPTSASMARPIRV